MSAIADTPLTQDLGPPAYTETLTRRGLSMSTTWLDPSVVRIRVNGDVDASNANQLVQYVFGHAANCRHIILDLQDVDFFATAGFTSLRIIDWRCADAAITWTVVSSRPVSRVLEICDPRSSLPVA